MARLKPWYDVIKPREDLREGKPMDASEFAVHLDHVRDGQASKTYQDPVEFFGRTYLTSNLKGLAVEVLRRLNGVQTETSAVFNLSTQFGGGKTHSLTLLYHLARGGAKARQWPGVAALLKDAEVANAPEAAVACFVGTEFDSLSGRGGEDGTPKRMTPWGEIAWQLGGAAAFAVVAEHDASRTCPGGDVINRFLPKDRPCLILMDEVMNFVSRHRRAGMADGIYYFLQNLSEAARGRNNVVLVASLPASVTSEMTQDDEADFQRYKKVLDRLGKAVILSAERETSKIIRLRLFDWDQLDTFDGKVQLRLPKEAVQTAAAYAAWIQDHKSELPAWFPFDQAQDAIQDTYPFHPTVLSVFERKWQSLPRFQQTRGILRLLALWVSRAYSQGYGKASADPLITLGSAPLEDSLFRTAMFEQLGEQRLEPAVTTDIDGKPESHALRLDAEASETLSKQRLYRRTATAMFFESNGGQGGNTAATIPELRLAVGHPDLDIGNVETVVETLASTCYYLSAEPNRYRFGLRPNLNKLLSDRRASIKPEGIDERMAKEVQAVFSKRQGLEPVFFPKKSSDIADRAVLSLVVLSPDETVSDPATATRLIGLTKDCGNSSRTYKSALIWSVCSNASALREETRRLLAWEDIRENEARQLDETQRDQLDNNLKTSKSDLKEAVWRAYHHVAVWGEDQKPRFIDLGLVTSSSANNLTELILQRLRTEEIVVEQVGPNFLIRNWNPAFPAWSTRALRDAFFASPIFPRLLDAAAIKQTIAVGVSSGRLAYGHRTGDKIEVVAFKKPFDVVDIEISDDVVILQPQDAERLLAAAKLPETEKQVDRAQDGPGLVPVGPGVVPSTTPVPTSGTSDPPTASHARLNALLWQGEVPSQKWNQFYLRVVGKVATTPGLKLSVKLDLNNQGGISPSQVEDLRAALRELGLNDAIETR
jgi:hypothetical protein